MKLRNLMYATMIACAFASCSNDDVPTPDNGNPDAQGGTSLTVKFDKAADTKAAGDITSLSMLVFDADGKLEVDWKLSELKQLHLLWKREVMPLLMLY